MKLEDEPKVYSYCYMSPRRQEESIRTELQDGLDGIEFKTGQ